MTPYRLPRYRLLAGACVLILAGLSPAAAQFLPTPTQTGPAGQFPPPPGAQRQDPAFPPVPGQKTSAQPQDSAFPPPPGAGSSAPGGFVARPGGISVAPGGSSFSSAPPAGGGFGGGGGGGFGGGGGGGQPSEAQRVCLTFPALRTDVEKEFGLIKAAGERKASREEACPLFKNAVAKETKMLKFLETNRTLCGVPLQAINQVKANHTNTIRIRNQICSNAPAGPAAGPSLSDALGGPVIADDPSAAKGHGTFNTLTGNVLSR